MQSAPARRAADPRSRDVADRLLAALLKHLREAGADLLVLGAAARGGAASLLEQEVRDRKHDREAGHHQQHDKREVDARRRVARLVAVVDELVLCLHLSVRQHRARLPAARRHLAVGIRRAVCARDHRRDRRKLVRHTAAREVAAQVPRRHKQRRARVLHVAAVHEDLRLVGLGAARHVPVAKRRRVPQHALLAGRLALGVAAVQRLAVVARHKLVDAVDAAGELVSNLVDALNLCVTRRCRVEQHRLAVGIKEALLVILAILLIVVVLVAGRVTRVVAVVLVVVGVVVAVISILIVVSTISVCIGSIASSAIPSKVVVSRVQVATAVATEVIVRVVVVVALPIKVVIKISIVTVIIVGRVVCVRTTTKVIAIAVVVAVVLGPDSHDAREEDAD
mmetsp:Transcript_39082/g.116235  ORF Transcript_39082/g.116235 Transcript_39082/m.116235 type:complete len:394 (-) Transcript_39082:301-1482(-)